MYRIISFVLLTLTVSLLSSCSVKPVKALNSPFADTHLHFNWNQEEIISAKEVINILEQHNVSLAVVSSRPSSNALKLRKAGGDWVLPIYSPYYKPGIKHTWYRDPQVLTHAREALSSGQYFGVGEVHLVSGLGPSRENAIFKGLLQLAKEYDLPVLLHTDSSRFEYLLPICQENKEIRFIWAHAGGILNAEQVDRLMAQCENVWVEMSARDPWHYGLFTDEALKLLPGWKALFEKYPDRFMTGTDPVWNAHQTYRWYESDEGWSHYGKLNNFHRQWLHQLNPVLEKKIRIDNALRFYKYKVE